MSFNFTTHGGNGIQVPIPTRNDWSGYTLAAEFDDNSGFRTPTSAGTVNYSSGNITLSLSSTEVNTLGGGVYRIKATKNGQTTIVTDGRITFNAAAPVVYLVPGNVYNNNGSVNKTKRLHVKLTADGNDIDDLIVESVN